MSNNIFDTLNLQIKEQKKHIKDLNEYYNQLIYVENEKLRFMKGLKVNMRQGNVHTQKKNKKLRDWNKLTLEQKLDSALPDDRATEDDDLPDGDSLHKPNAIIKAVDREFEEYIKKRDEDLCHFLY